jgi:dipeptidyl aminopeptidase/acylaminoacyl peptidase
LDPVAYHLLDLLSGTRKLLVNAPLARSLGWHAGPGARWSADGQSLLLSDTFLPLDVSDSNEIAERERRPYIAILRLRSGKLSPMLAVNGGLDPQRFGVDDARFADPHTVVMNFDRSYLPPEHPSVAIFRQRANGRWRQIPGSVDPRLAALKMKRVELRESTDQRPLIVAEDGVGNARTIWDPNPQLQAIALGAAEVIQGQDSSGYQWKAGLVRPSNYAPGKRYPLVIQTHGFVPRQFLSNGIFSSAFAAQALAARGMAVIQIGWNVNNFGTSQEGSGEVLIYRSVVKKLAEEGIVDPAKVGAIGFSRSVYHVLSALTASEPVLAAASVTDGVTFGYFEYLISVDGLPVEREADPINGGKPFGAEGLKSWLDHSPDFNLDKAAAPLLLLQPGVQSVFADWEPYAALRWLKKPVDLVMLQPGSHVMTNPTQRLASETVNVDWFDFWLNGHEDPDSTKAEQYQRWERLCDMQVAQNPNQPAFCVRTKPH